MPSNPHPRYYSIYRLLKQALESGDYEADAPLPTESALCELHGVSRQTIRRSLGMLQAEGLIHRRQGSGAYANGQKVKKEPLPTDINSLMVGLNRMGHSTQVRVLSFDYRTVTLDVQRHLELAPKSQVQKAERVRFHGGRPFSLLTTYLPEFLGKKITKEDLAQRPLYELLQVQGVVLSAAEQSITAIIADHHHSKALEVEEGAALLCIRRITRDADGRPVEYLVAAYNPARFEYGMRIEASELNSSTES